ncbi:predicted protein [Sclerotinia sclerotiorum 1980 UF-70]|uniref:Uncharacterized protein n=2 Tax=Sclerotinia sclerotiorum (strain ATCC 18683 / 1980 / Ss-1) TaxID=665079 RepID=A7F8S4_SCLS1|nr:predicted protein [Sclerotinia sclerotiorum 1980 UF-70]APA13885.1 hypothetical protein sscle_11g086550 [Sclerotinia sclerotiorum 1980 UF-70]EDN99145.1 predicted protein [Sclerotinia sclerotiorum 1980 UF-70]
MGPPSKVPWPCSRNHKRDLPNARKSRLESETQNLWGELDTVIGRHRFIGCRKSLGLAVAILNAIWQLQDDLTSKQNTRVGNVDAINDHQRWHHFKTENPETNEVQTEFVSYTSATPSVLIITPTSPLVAKHWRNFQVLIEAKNTKVASRGIKVEVGCAAFGDVQSQYLKLARNADTNTSPSASPLAHNFI